MNYNDIKNQKNDDLDNIKSQLTDTDFNNKIDTDYKNKLDILQEMTNFIKKYNKKDIDNIFSSKTKLITVDINNLEEFSPRLTDLFLKENNNFINLLRDRINLINNDFIEDSDKDYDYKIKFDNVPTGKVKCIKDINVKDIGSFISVEGLVRQYTLLLPREYKRFYECQDCRSITEVQQNDFEVKKVFFCDCCNSKNIKFLEDKTEYINSQKIRIQESLDNLEGGEIAHFVDLLIDDDKIYNVPVGDKIIITGDFRLKENQKETFKESYIKAIDIKKTKDDFYNLEVSADEEKQIREYSKRKDILELFSESIAPHIYGYEEVKKGIALQLIGGSEKDDSNSIQRSNIHILLLGDPGLGKSEFLLSTVKLSPKARYTAGRTTSGVGLVGAVVKDDFAGKEWSLKPGALVLGNLGMVAIDEFDKMDHEERSALHETMAQGTVTISKAGINQTMNAKTSILAAANPKYSKYDLNKSFVDQVDISSSLLSRFDLFYLLKDDLPEEEERRIAEGIINVHSQLPMDKDIIPRDLLRKYIALTKTIKPKMSEKLNKNILDFYLGIKKESNKSGVPSIFRRFVGTIVRLSEAHARLRLSPKVCKKDVEVAKALLTDSLNNIIIDVDNNKLDVNMLFLGKTGTDLDRQKAINDFIDDNIDCSYSDIYSEVKRYGIDNNKLNELLNDMELRGSIYKPNKNIYRSKGD